LKEILHGEGYTDIFFLLNYVFGFFEDAKTFLFGLFEESNREVFSEELII